MLTSINACWTRPSQTHRGPSRNKFTKDLLNSPVKVPHVPTARQSSEGAIQFWCFKYAQGPHDETPISHCAIRSFGSKMDRLWTVVYTGVQPTILNKHDGTKHQHREAITRRCLSAFSTEAAGKGEILGLTEEVRVSMS
jgi:hypothetical protein